MKNIFKDNEAMLLLVLYIILILLACLSITSCRVLRKPEEAVYLQMSDGRYVEVVCDEYDRQFLKQHIRRNVYMYIPLPIEKDEGDYSQDTLKFYYIKN